MIVVGIDPDSEKMGFAVYQDVKLSLLNTVTIPELITHYLPELQKYGPLVFSIEDVAAQNFIYSRNVKREKKVQGAVSNSLGRCQQNQVELIRWLDHYEIPYKLHKPTASNWADNKAFFERVTGWKYSSNRDSRSAAYFGWLEAK